MKHLAVPSMAVMQRPSELSRRFDPSKLLGHYAMGRSLPLEPPGWHRRHLYGWTLVHEPSLPVQEILDASGVEVGWLLGHPIDLQAPRMVTAPIRAPLQCDSREVGRDFEDWLYLLGGRFAAIVLRPRPVLYPDAVAALPVLFDADLECVASSPFLLCSQEGTVPDSPLVDTIAVFETGNEFTLGTTSHARADMLLPNHVLDLSSGQQHRVWPPGPLEPDDVASLVDRIATTVEKTLAAVVATGRPNIGLTAGADSRAVLACSRGFVDRARFFTLAQPDDIGATDLATTPALARRFGLDYRVLPWVEPTVADVELFMYRTGCLVGEPRGRKATQTYNQLGGGEVYVSALGMEIARGHYWHRSDRPDERLEPEELLTRFCFLVHPEYLRRTADWLRALPEGINRLDAITLFDMETIWGPWGGPLTLAYPEAYTFTLYPFAHRAFVDAVLRLPWKYQAMDRLRKDVIASRWKELLEIPFNRQPFPVAVRRKANRLAGLGRAGLSQEAWKRKLNEASRGLRRSLSTR